MITDRQKLILLSVVEEYIKTAQPVGSAAIYETNDFDASPATLRNELAELEEAGYLSQPHTSAGRVPTDSGYRFFVDAVMAEKWKKAEKARQIMARLARLKEEEDRLFAELAKTIAALSKNTVLSGSLDAPMLFKAGINEALNQPEMENYALRSHFGHIVDSFEENLRAISRFIEDNNPAVFIGRENPIGAAREFSMIVSKCRILSDDGIVVILGPKRMNYRRNLQLLNSLNDLL